MSNRKFALRSIAGIIVATFSLFVVFQAASENPLPSVDRLRTSPVLRDLKPNPMPKPPSTAPEQTVAEMYVPQGFRVELIASEPQLHQPIAFAWDERGRLWVAESNSYPAKRPD